MQNLQDHISEVERKIDYQFDNEDLLLQAFTRSSYTTDCGGENNEVLEFLGDEILDFYVTKIIAERFGFTKSQSRYFDEEKDFDEYCIIANKDESDFTELKKLIVKNETLAKRIDKLGFYKYMYLGDSDLDNPKFNKNLTKVKADLFEAIIGAIAIDSDWNPELLQESIESMLQIDEFLDDVDTEEERPEQFKEENAINTLKELAEHGKCSIPQYNQLDHQVRDENEKLWWSCTCTVRSWNMQHTAYAPTKKEAKRYAAYLMLCDYYKLPNEFENDEVEGIDNIKNEDEYDDHPDEDEYDDFYGDDGDTYSNYDYEDY